MKLYLTRHGEAVAAEINPDRPLSALGEKQVNSVGEKLHARGIVVDKIYHSGIVRARQTAELLAPQVQAGSVLPLPGLRPEDLVEPMEIEVATWTQPVMLVGHLPFMAYLLEALTLHSASVIFNPATVACLAPVGDGWILEWVIHAAETR
ncbi:MAG TPA: phosphohistidine phosphatase SixA [Gammaproteobacteria bacterium]|nr:phosphohistidine phosphatase SixA [Gammaproteobacteria bacterium]